MFQVPSAEFRVPSLGFLRSPSPSSSSNLALGTWHLISTWNPESFSMLMFGRRIQTLQIGHHVDELLDSHRTVVARHLRCAVGTEIPLLFFLFVLYPPRRRGVPVY